MRKLILFTAMALCAVSFAAKPKSDREIISGKDTTPLKVLCRAPGATGGILVQFVKDKQADPGVYTVQRGMFYPANKIKRVTYELVGETWSKVGHLDNGGKVRLHFAVGSMELVGDLKGSNAFFGDDSALEGCEDLKLK